MLTKLEVLNAMLPIIEKATGFPWQTTSYIRNSPSHRFGYSIDWAPSHVVRKTINYAGDKLSDPILARRPQLVKDLADAIPLIANAIQGVDIGLFLETDHIHMQFGPPPNSKKRLVGLFVWSEPKACYADSTTRHAIPHIN